jgi:hypothetical protein
LPRPLPWSLPRTLPRPLRWIIFAMNFVVHSNDLYMHTQTCKFM